MNADEKGCYVAMSPKEQGLYGVRGQFPLPYPTDEHGNRVCRWCHGELPKRRSSWCSNECRDEYYLCGGLWRVVQRAVFRRDEGTCQICGAKDPYVAMEVDHITPVICGGDDRMNNLRLLCVACHRAETNKLNQSLRA